VWREQPHLAVIGNTQLRVELLKDWHELFDPYASLSEDVGVAAHECATVEFTD